LVCCATHLQEERSPRFNWHLVDYQTNRIDDEAHRAVVDAFYRSQLELYARQWEALTGEKVLQKSLLYVRDGHESVL
jgi:ATP-dependent exoDNAse (exonuclease V) beta subunit